MLNKINFRIRRIGKDGDKFDRIYFIKRVKKQNLRRNIILQRLIYVGNNEKLFKYINLYLMRRKKRSIGDNITDRERELMEELRKNDKIEEKKKYKNRKEYNKYYKIEKEKKNKIIKENNELVKEIINSRKKKKE
jgi:hypothetical protein